MPLKRTRNRYCVPLYTNKGVQSSWISNLPAPLTNSFAYSTIEDFRVPGEGGSRVAHTKFSTASGFAAKVWNSTTGQVIDDISLYQWPVAVQTTKAYTEAARIGKLFPTTFKHSKLPTSNGLNTLIFIKEFEETLALFTKKFWKAMTLWNSYGTWQWGIQPLISDIQNILEMLIKVCTYAEKSDAFREGLKVQRTVKDVNLAPRVVGDVDITVKCNRAGHINYGSAQEAQKWLDRLGLYPDLNTLWAALPLSFALDWFIPVGQYLSSIVPSGNVREIGFSGWYSRKITLDWKQTGVGALNSWEAASSGKLSGTYSYYTRNFQQSYLSIRPASRPRDFFAVPDELGKMFGTAYLAFTRLPGEERRAINKELGRSIPHKW